MVILAGHFTLTRRYFGSPALYTLFTSLSTNWINGFIGSFASGVFRQNLQVRTVANTSAITRMSSWCIDAFIWFIGSGNPSFTAKGTIIHYQIYRNVKV